MKTLKYFSLLIFIISLISCNPCKYVAKHPECFPPDSVHETSTSSVRDSVTWLQLDTSLFDAIFECDSMNNVLIKEVNEYKSKGVKTRVVFKDNHLQLSMFTDSIAILNKIISEHKTSVTYVKNPVNDELKRQATVYKDRLHNRRWLLWYFIGSLVSRAVYLYLKFI